MAGAGRGLPGRRHGRRLRPAGRPPGHREPRACPAGAPGLHRREGAEHPAPGDEQRAGGDPGRRVGAPEHARRARAAGRPDAGDGRVHDRRSNVPAGERQGHRGCEQPTGTPGHRFPRGGAVPCHPRPPRRLPALRLPALHDAARQLGAQPRQGRPGRAGAIRRLRPRHHRPGLLRPAPRIGPVRSRRGRGHGPR